MRRTLTLLASTVLLVLFASGAALAYGGGGDPTNIIRCDGAECKGTTKSDSMRGSSSRDVMYALAGNDDLYGRSGRDDLRGFDGYDSLEGGDGEDGLWGGAGKDRLLGGRGPDTLNGGTYHDGLRNGPGDDEMFGGPDESSDSMYVVDQQFGTVGQDFFDGGRGEDVYYFRGTQFSNWGHATISDSDENIMPDQPISDDTWPSWPGGDWLNFLDWESNLTITLSPVAGPEMTDETGTNTVEWASPGEFSRINSGSGDDTITGDAWPNWISGFGGADTIDAGAGDDVVYAAYYVDDSVDTIDCGDGYDTVHYEPGVDMVSNCEELQPLP